MLGWLSAGIYALVILLAGAIVPVSADTGTYGISSYIVTLEPQSSGEVKITIEQQWKVLSGSIPWVTVGLPNSSFSVEDYSGNATKVSASNEGGFSGVRVDLDKDYQPGQTFNIKFSVLQGKLLERLTSEKKWRIDFTPGWYDRAAIDYLKINLVSPVTYETYTLVKPVPSSINGDNNLFSWESPGLPAGSRYNIAVESTDGNFLSAAAGQESSGGIFNIKFFVIIAIILAVGFLVFWGFRKQRQAQDAAVRQRVITIEEEMASDQKKKKEVEEGFDKYVKDENIQPDAQGRYYDRGYGDYITPAIWAGIIVNQYHQRQNTPGGKSSHPSCACACVSCACACACACAGGGAAGCSRKSLHECRTCSTSRDSQTKQ
jgi:hypothetical protein